MKAVAELKPDLVLLDVQMPKLDGFEVLELIGRDQTVVFITAYDQYALKAFDVHAVDYLLKPFSAERFQEAMIRVRERLQAKAGVDQRRRYRAHTRRQAQDGTRRARVDPGRRERSRAADRHHRLRRGAGRLRGFQIRGEAIPERPDASAVEGTLDPARFVRIHRSYILNIDRIAKVELYAKDSRIAILRDGTRLPVSRAGYARLSQLL